MHFGTADEIRARRNETLQAAYAADPVRFRHRKPEAAKLPSVAWINDPNANSEKDPAQKTS